MYQTGGDENNYVSWTYSKDELLSPHRLYVSYDGGLGWQHVKDKAMSLRLLDIVDMFSEAYKTSASRMIKTFPGVPSLLIVDGPERLLGEIENNITTTEDGMGLTVQKNKLLISFVTDSSGSSGWNDRFDKKSLYIRKAIQYIQDKYPNLARFDIISYGAYQIGEVNFVGAAPVLSIKMDANKPHGTIQNTDGTEPAISDGIIAWGLKDLQEGHVYTVSKVSINNFVLDDNQGVLDPTLGINKAINYQSLGKASKPLRFSVENEGPPFDGDPVLAVVINSQGSSSVNMRKLTNDSRTYLYDLIEQPLSFNDTRIYITSPDMTTEGEAVDVVGPDKISQEHFITTIGSNHVDVSPALLYDFENSYQVSGAILQQSYKRDIVVTDATTIEIYLKDTNVSNAVTFFLQTTKGGQLEWQITAHSDWMQSLYFFSDEDAVIDISAFDTTGKPLPDGTEVGLYVDSKYKAVKEKREKQRYRILNSPLATGATIVYLEDVNEIEKDDLATLVGYNEEEQELTESGFIVISVDQDNRSIEIFPANTVSTWDVIEIDIEPLQDIQPDRSIEFYVGFDAVDFTPIHTGKILPPNLYLSQDKKPVDPTETDLNRYNQDQGRIRNVPIDVPVIDTVASIRIMPVTEDHYQTNDIKQANFNEVFDLTEAKEEDKILQEALYDEYQQLTEQQTGEEIESFTVATNLPGAETSFVADADYEISSPVFLFGGIATSCMRTFSKEFTEEETGYGYSYDMFSLPGEEINDKKRALLRSYEVTPYIFLRGKNDKVAAVMELNELDVKFVLPYQIYTRSESGKVYAVTCAGEDGLTGEPTTKSKSWIGIPAASNDTFTFNYLLVNKGILYEEENAYLRIKIFDMLRNRNEMTEPESVSYSFDTAICNDTFEPSTFYSKRESEEDGTIQTYLDTYDSLQEATYVPGYTKGGILAPIENGRASFTIEAPAQIIAQLEVVAEFVFPDNPRESIIRSEILLIYNPLKIIFSGGGKIISGYDNPPIEIGATVLYLGMPAPDNITVAFQSNSHARWPPGDTGGIIETREWHLEQTSQLRDVAEEVGQISKSTKNLIEGALKGVDLGRWPATPINPSVSKTKDETGVATDVFLGSHGEVAMHRERREMSNVWVGDTELINLSCNYNGFTVALTEEIEWISALPLLPKTYYHLDLYRNGEKLSGSTATMYTDGWDQVIAVADLPISLGVFNGLEDYQKYLLGYDPVTGEETGTGKSLNISFRGGRGLISSTTWNNQRPIDPVSGKSMGEQSAPYSSLPPIGWAASDPIYQVANISSEPEIKECCEIDECCAPACWLITGESFFKFEGKNLFAHGVKGKTEFESELPVVCGQSVSMKPNDATISWIDPLGVSIFANHKSGFENIIRDGQSHTSLEIDVSFSGKPLPLIARQHDVRTATGELVAMPTVYFDLFMFKETDIGGGQVLREKVYDPSLQLSLYSDVVKLKYTSVNENHYHILDVDVLVGNGKTTRTINSETHGEITNHTHTVVEFEISDSVDLNGKIHNHSIRSTAETLLYPIANQKNEICLIIRTSYDASRTLITRNYETTICSGLTAESEIDEYTINLCLPNGVDVQSGVSTNDEGFTISANILNPAHLPPVPDGQRVSFDIKAYLPETQQEKFDVLFFGASEKRDVAAIEITASTEINDKIVTETVLLPLQSSLAWIPDYRSLLPEITEDPIYLNTAINDLQTIGASQCVDALDFAAKRLANYELEDPAWNNTAKTIVLLSDGEEDSSQKCLATALDSVTRMNRSGVNPVIVAGLGNIFPSDRLILDYIVDVTNGTFTHLIESTMDDRVKESIGEGLVVTNEGSLIKTVDFGEQILQKNVSLQIEIPNGASALFRFRFGDDKMSFCEWSKYVTVESDTEINFASYIDIKIKRYLQYELVLRGNEIYEAPVYKKIRYRYIRPREHEIVFQPFYPDMTEDDFINEIVISDYVEDDNYSDIKYGFTHYDTTDSSHYYLAGQPLTESGKRHIVLSRFTEPALTNNQYDYLAMNGPWLDGAEINVYFYDTTTRTSRMVLPNKYTINPKVGLISFAEIVPTTTDVLLDIKVAPLFRVICFVKNYDQDIAAKIHFVDILYNITTMRMKGKVHEL